MPTPSLYPLFLKAQSGGGGGVPAGTVYVETLGIEVDEMVDVEVVDLSVDVELVSATEVELVEIVVDVEVIC